jgi:hypothetical protein
VARANRPLDPDPIMPKTKLVHCGCTDSCIKLVSTKTRSRHWKIIEEEQAEELAALAGIPVLNQDNNSVDSDPNTIGSEHHDDLTEEEGAEEMDILQEDTEMDTGFGPDDCWDGTNPGDEEMATMEHEREAGGDECGITIDADMVSTCHK